MKREDKGLKKGDLVLVQPMRYCYSFAEGDIENLSGEEDTPHVGMHWTGDGFKARILSFATLDTPHNTEDYLEVKIFGKGRKHFVKRNEEKTKVIWIQQRLVTKCEDTKE